MSQMADHERDTLMRMAAFEHVRGLSEVYDHLTVNELKPGFVFDGERMPLVNPRRGVFKPREMRFLLSIKTVFPRPGRRVWYDDQREVHRQIFESEETVDYAFMGQDPDAADNGGGAPLFAALFSFATSAITPPLDRQHLRPHQ